MKKETVRILKSKLTRFISAMDLAKITPAESEIDNYLGSQNNYRDVFIKFCFHYWERRHERYIVNKALSDLKINQAI